MQKGERRIIFQKTGCQLGGSQPGPHRRRRRRRRCPQSPAPPAPPQTLLLGRHGVITHLLLERLAMVRPVWPRTRSSAVRVRHGGFKRARLQRVQGNLSEVAVRDWRAAASLDNQVGRPTSKTGACCGQELNPKHPAARLCSSESRLARDAKNQAAV